MIANLNLSSINKILELIEQRKLSLLNIKNKDNAIYVEYKSCTKKNNSNKMLELYSIMNDIKENIINDTLIHCNLQYDIRKDEIVIANITTSNDKTPNASLKDIFTSLKKYLEQNNINDNKIKLTKNKRSFTITYKDLVNQFESKLEKEGE